MVRIKPEDGVLRSGPLPSRWNHSEVRFDIHDFDVDEERAFGTPPVAFLVPMAYWDGWTLWIMDPDHGIYKADEYFCQRLGESMSMATAELLNRGVIEDF